MEQHVLIYIDDMIVLTSDSVPLDAFKMYLSFIVSEEICIGY